MNAPSILIVSMGLIAGAARAQIQTAAASSASSSTNAYFASYGMISVDSEETAATLQEMVGDRAKLTYYKPNNKLLVYGSPEAHRILRDALRDLNAPRRNVRIEVSFDEQHNTSETAASISGSGAVVVTHAGVSGTAHITPRAESRTTATTAQTRQRLLVQSGSEASLRVGETVPFVNELIVLGRRYGYISQEVTLRNVGASLDVRARVIGDGPEVQLTLTPELSGVSSGRSQRIRYTQLATTLTVSDGEAITLASFGENTDFYRLFLAGIGRSREASSMQITLRATIEAPSGAPAPASANERRCRTEY
jgi:type II secretory pathway component GspD/PulD (secretin)